MKTLLGLSSLRLVAVLSALAAPARAQTWNYNEATDEFSYSDSQGSITGVFVRPSGAGPFPAVIINHGQGGTPGGYSRERANEFVQWGLVCIGPELTHVSGGDTSGAGSGNSPENVARGQTCLRALAYLGYVDMSRVAIWGHSKGAYASIGQAAAMGSSIKAAGISAGGCTIGGNGANQAPPTDAEANPVAALFLLFHGTVDPAVSPQFSLNFKGVLDAHAVANDRITFDTSALTPDFQHNLHKTPSFLADMLIEFQAWLTTHGVLTPAATTVAFQAIAADDGWVLESTETSGTGGSIDSAGALLLGDDAADRQYRVVLSFDTASLPDTATIVSATLQLKRASISGTHPFTTHGTARVDIRTGGFGGAAALAAGDFNAAATALQVASLSNPTANGALSTGSLNGPGLAAINKTGTTQFRVHFSADDNDDNGADTVSFYSANNANPANRPQLIVQYQ